MHYPLSKSWQIVTKVLKSTEKLLSCLFNCVSQISCVNSSSMLLISIYISVTGDKELKDTGGPTPTPLPVKGKNLWPIEPQTTYSLKLLYIIDKQVAVLCPMFDSWSIIMWLRPNNKKRCVYCNMSGKKWIGRSGFNFFFNRNNWNAHIGCYYASPA